VLARSEDAGRRRERRALAAYLVGVDGSDRAALLAELAWEDLDLRRAGEPARAGDDLGGATEDSPRAVFCMV
jgi:hypothetical protein